MSKLQDSIEREQLPQHHRNVNLPPFENVPDEDARVQEYKVRLAQRLFPDAQLAYDNDGQLVIYTGVYNE
tara:strand:- start:1084 stop:1293 length:210 start_codon:yes stop_codon:yes gene_type:complete